ncbi:MAG: hypothetical protein JO288_23530 [Hyphomicrobiales bacterium]|nr:hypothetical protein [Hyphomicrobiales bacterium]
MDPRQGAAKRTVNAEEMLAELKRVVDSSMRPPSVPPPSAPMVSNPGFLGSAHGQSDIDKGSGRPIRGKADNSLGQPTDLQDSTGPRSRNWKLTAGGLALAGAAAIGASFALNKAAIPPQHELSVAVTAAPVTPQNKESLEPSSGARPLMQDSRQAALLQAGASETLPHVDTAPATASPLPNGGEAAVGASDPASFGLDSAAPAFTANPAAWAPWQTAKPGGTFVGAAPPTPIAADSPPPAEMPKPQPRADATPTAPVSTEAARPSPPKIDSTRKLPGKTPLPKPAKSAKAAAKPVAQTERQSHGPARPNDAERPPAPAQDGGDPAAAPPAAATSIEQRLADGMTHAFSYLMRFPAALAPHPADPNSDAH